MGDLDGAANRAYYAMFNGARAMLEAVTSLDMRDIRRHTAVLQLFSLHVVRPGLVEKRLSADLNKVFEGRAIADYEPDATSPEECREPLALMDRLIETHEPTLDPR